MAKIKQLDYSSIMNANSAMLSAKSASTANVSNTIGRSNIQKMDSIYAHQQKAMKLQAAADVVNSTLQLAEGVASAVKTYKAAKKADEQASATNDYYEKLGQFEAERDELRRNDRMFNDDLTYTEEYNQLYDKYMSEFKDLGYSKDTTRALQENFTSVQGQEALSQVRAAISEINTVTGQQRQQLMTDGINDCIREGSDASRVHALIDSWTDLPEASRQYYKDQADRAVQAGIIQNAAFNMTDSEGFNDASAYIDQMWKNGDIKTMEERDKLKAASFTRYQNNLTYAKQTAVDTFTDTYSHSGSIADSRAASQDFIRTMPVEMAEELVTLLDTTQYNQFLKENPWVNELDTMEDLEILRRLDEVEADEKGYFFGMSDAKAYFMKGLKDTVDARIPVEIQQDYKAFKESADLYKKALDAKAISPSQYVANVKDLYAQFPSLNGYSGAMSILFGMISDVSSEKLGTYLKGELQTKINEVVKAADGLELANYDSTNFKYGLTEKVLDYLYDNGLGNRSQEEISNWISSLPAMLPEIYKSLNANSDIKDDNWINFATSLSRISDGTMYYVETADFQLKETMGDDGKTKYDLWGGESNMGRVRGIDALSQGAWDNAVNMGVYTMNHIADGIGYDGDGSFADVEQADYAKIDGGMYPAFLCGDGNVYSVIPSHDIKGGIDGLNIMRKEVSEDGKESWNAYGRINSKGTFVPVDPDQKSFNVNTGYYVGPYPEEGSYTDEELEDAKFQAQYAFSAKDFVKDQRNKGSNLTSPELVEAYWDPVYKALNEQYYPGSGKTAKAIVQELVDSGTITQDRMNEFFRASSGHSEFDTWFDKHNGNGVWALNQTTPRPVDDGTAMNYPKTSPYLEEILGESESYKDFKATIKGTAIYASDADLYYFQPVYRALATYYETGADLKKVLRDRGVDEQLITEFMGDGSDWSAWGSWRNLWKKDPQQARDLAKSDEFFTTGRFSTYTKPPYIELTWPSSEEMASKFRSELGGIISQEEAEKKAGVLNTARTYSNSFSEFKTFVNNSGEKILERDLEEYYFSPIYGILNDQYGDGRTAKKILKDAGVDPKIIQEFCGNGIWGGRPYRTWRAKWSLSH